MSRETEFLLPSPFHMQIEITFFDTTFCKSFVQEKMGAVSPQSIVLTAFFLNYNCRWSACDRSLFRGCGRTTVSSKRFRLTFLPSRYCDS